MKTNADELNKIHILNVYWNHK